ncbi:MAG: hypothetical protein KDA42_07065 [Planctomycetales bacterium]|nr:hypothetical protein [Planctomycetales bacterium]
MALKSGKDGRVEVDGAQVAAITSWRLRTSATALEYFSSATNGWKSRLPGPKDSRGEIEFQLDFDNPLTEKIEEGALVTLRLFLDRTRFYSVPCMIESLDWEPVDIDRGTTIAGKATFLGAGPVTKPVF